MNIHTALIDLMGKLGYNGIIGICQGFAIKWLEAFFLSEEKEFEDRVLLIASYSDNLDQLVEKLNQVKLKKGLNLTYEDKKFLDVLSFCDNLYLSQFSSGHYHLFHKPISQEDIEELSKFTGSDKIINQGGLKEVSSDIGIFTDEEFIKYLQSISSIINKMNLPSDKTIGFLLTSINHGIALTYSAEKGWGFTDINSFYYRKTNCTEDLIAKKVRQGINFKNEDHITLGLSILGVSSDPHLEALKAELDKIKIDSKAMLEKAVLATDGTNFIFKAVQHGRISIIEALNNYNVDWNMTADSNSTLAFFAAQNGNALITRELVKHEVDFNIAGIDGATPAFIASQNGHVAVLAELPALKVDFNKANKYGFTPAYAASQNGDVAVIAELAKHKVDFDKPNNKTITPAMTAAYNGHALVIAELAKHKVDFNKTNRDGATPVYAAAQNGYVSVIAELAKHKADLNKATNIGYTPAFIAAENGHAAVIEELAKHKVDFNKSEDVDQNTPAFIAAYNGHALVIAELGKHKVDFNKANKAGGTPAYVAAQNGFVSVIAELAKHKVDFDKALNVGATPAHVAAQNGHVAVIAELAKHKVDFDKASVNGETPAYIAAQMGHTAVIAELAKHKVDFDKANVTGETPAFVAAQKGHTTVIEELAKHKVDFNKAQENGATPAFIAAQKGHIEVIKTFIRLGVHFNLAFNASAEDLEQFASRYDNLVIQRMNNFIQSHSQDNNQILQMTPYDIAVVMGNTEIAQLINNSKKEATETEGYIPNFFKTSGDENSTGVDQLTEQSFIKK